MHRSLSVQHYGVCRGVKAIYRANCGARCIGAVHAGHRYRTFAWFPVIKRDNAAAVDAPRYLVLTGGDARVALDAAVGVAEEFHSSHDPASSSRCDLTQGGLRFLHPCRRIIAVGRDRVGALTEHDRIRPCRVVHAQILTCEPAAEVEWHPGNAPADALGNERRDLSLRAVLRSSDPNKPAILDAAISR